MNYLKALECLGYIAKDLIATLDHKEALPTEISLLVRSAHQACVVELCHGLLPVCSVACDVRGRGTDMNSVSLVVYAARASLESRGNIEALLSVLCRDGGHYLIQHGAEKAALLALEEVGRLRQVEAEPVAGWAAVSERLPKDDRLVLVWNSAWGLESMPAVGRYARGHEDPYDGVWNLEDDDDEPEPITHWMPLPSPPKVTP